MSEIRYYHLQKTPEDQALPQIAFKAYEAGHRIIVRTQNAEQATCLDKALWTFRPDVFLPHGTDNPERQPVFLTCGHENPNGAKTLLLATGCTPVEGDAYDLICVFLDGHQPAQIEAGRASWKQQKDTGHTLSYWQQTDNGWEKKV